MYVKMIVHSIDYIICPSRVMMAIKIIFDINISHSELMQCQSTARSTGIPLHVSTSYVQYILYIYETFNLDCR